MFKTTNDKAKKAVILPSLEQNFIFFLDFK